MPLFPTPEEKRKFIQSKGVDPLQWDLDETPDDNGDLQWKPVIAESPIVQESVPAVAPIQPDTTSRTEAFLRNAANAVVPTATGIGGGALLGSKLGRVAGPWGSLGGGLLGALGGGFGGSKLQDLVTTENWKKELATAQQEHPYISMFGSAVPSALAFNPIESIKQFPTAVKGLGKLLTQGRTAITDRTANILANTAINTGVGAGVNVGEQLSREDKSFDVKELLLATGLNAVLNEPTKLGKKVFRLQGVDDIPAKYTAPDFPRNLKRNKPLLAPEDYTDVFSPAKKGYGTGERPLESTYPKEEVVPPNKELDLQFQRKSALDAEEAKILKEENDAREEKLYQKTSDKLLLSKRPDLTKASKELAERRGMTYKEEPELEGEALGSYDDRFREVRISKKEGALDTPGHEIGGHGMVRDLLRSPVLRDRQIANKGLAAAGNEEELAKYVGTKVYGRQDTKLRGTKKQKLEQWFGDFSRHIKTKFKLASDKEVMDFIAQRTTEDAPYGTRREFLPKEAMEGVPSLQTPIPKDFQYNQEKPGVRLVMPGEKPNNNYRLRKDFEVSQSKKSGLPEQDLQDVLNTSPDEFVKIFSDKYKKPMTNKAYEIGSKLENTPENVKMLEDMEGQARQEWKSYMEDKDIENALKVSSKAQFFREAREYLTNSGSAEGMGGPNKSYQDESALEPERDFITSTEKELSRPRPWGLTLGNDGTLPVNTVRGKLEKNIPADELEALRASGLEDYLKDKQRVNLGELGKWIKENGPQLEVKKLEATGEVDKVNQELAAKIHAMESKGYRFDDNTGQAVMITPRGHRLTADDFDRLETKDLTSTELKDIEEYLSFNDRVNRASQGGTDSATARFTQVNPKPLDQMPGAVDILVRVPQNKVSLEDRISQGDVDPNTIEYKGDKVLSKPKFAGHHFGESDKNIVGWTRGYMETLPDGKKVFHVFELQSDWAQQYRKELEGAREVPENLYRQKTADRLNDPSLNYYEHLALKAVIKHAKENEADYIAVSDGETAMITEGHDRAAQFELFRELPAKTFEQRQEAAKWLKEDESSRRNEPVFDDNNQIVGVKQFIKKPSQEKGMRLHYDSTIPNILKKLTGSEGERVSFGEHQNTVSDDSKVTIVRRNLGATEARHIAQDLTAETGVRHEYDQIYEPEQDNVVKRFDKQPRKDLIFKNPDGTPKTDISARMFPLTQIGKRIENKEPFSMFSKSYQSESGLTDKDIFPNKRHGFFRSFESANDKVRRLGPVGEMVADKLDRFFARKDQYQAMFRGVPYSDIIDRARELKLKQKDFDAITAFVRGKYRKEDVPELSTEQKKLVDEIIQPLFKNVRKLQNEEGLEVEDNYGKLRGGKLSEYYIPDMLSDETINLFTKRPTSPEAQAKMNEWADYVVEESGGAIPFAEARDSIEKYIAALGGNKVFSIEFGALRKAAGYGLPESMREGNLLKIVSKYGRRAAQDLAYWKELQSDPKVAAALKLPKREGGVHSDPDIPNIIQTPEVQNALKFVFNDFSAVNNPRATSFARAVTNALLGAPTGVRDTVAMISNVSPYLQNFDDGLGFFKALGNLKEARRKSLETGARSGTMDLDRWYTLENPDKLTTIFNRAAEAFRKYQGRDLLENVNRIMTFGWGREMAKGKLADAIQGKEGAKEWLKKFGTLVDEKDYNKWDDSTLDQVAKNFVDRVQGTYDARGLPAGAFEGPFAPFIALSRWSLEKSNVIWKDVVMPARQGNFLPLLTYSLGTMLTGVTIRELNELMSGKKAADASFSEAMSEDNKLHAGAAVISLMQLGGFAGIMSDIAKAATDVTVSGEKPRGLAFPAMDFMQDSVVDGLRDYFQAVDSGSDPFKAGTDFIYHLLKTSVQNIRIADSRFLNREDSERSNKFRDYRVFQKLQGEEVPSLSQLSSGNRFGNKELREFKRTSSISEAAQSLPELLSKAIEEAKGDPYKLKAGLRRIKQNNYQTLPNPESLPMQFVRMLSFISKNQGADAASERLMDYIRQNAVNKAKAKMVP